MKALLTAAKTAKLRLRSRAAADVVPMSCSENLSHCWLEEARLRGLRPVCLLYTFASLSCMRNSLTSFFSPVASRAAVELTSATLKYLSARR